MLKVGPKSLITLVAVFSLCTCIDPYSPRLAGYESLLVVDGLITDANTSYTVKLSRTIQDQNSSPEGVSDATVFISSEAGASTYLVNSGKGVYKTDSLEFSGMIGKTYILHILANDGSEYESDPCLMQSVPDIDSIYFGRNVGLTNNGTESQEGVSVYLDSKGDESDRYFRWAFDETWKFKVPDPKRYNFNMADSALTLVPDVKEFCWKTAKSDNILIHSIYTGEPVAIKKEPIFFIAADQSDRLLIQYNILVKQYSISRSEFEFWNNLKQVNEGGGDIFAKQPFTVLSNIHNVNNAKERVLGYFQVSALKQMRKTLPFSKIVSMNLPLYHYSCERIIKEPLDYQTEWGPEVTWADLYKIFCVTSDYYFVEPIITPGTSHLEKMVFAKPECANCALTGIHTKPDFWVDLN